MMNLYFELIGLVYAYGERAVVLSEIEKEIKSRLEQVGFDLTSYSDAEVKLYVNPDHTNTMYGLEKESGIVIGISCELKDSTSGATTYLAKNGEEQNYWCMGGGGHDRRGRWFEGLIMERFMKALDASNRSKPIKR